VGPQQVHRERNDVQNPVHVSQSEDGLESLVRGRVAHVPGKAPAQQREFSDFSMKTRKIREMLVVQLQMVGTGQGGVVSDVNTGAHSSEHVDCRQL